MSKIAYFAPQDLGFYEGAIEIDKSHQVAMMRDSLGPLYYFPMYRNRCGAWKNYKDKGRAIAYSSHPDGAVKAHTSAIKHIRRSIGQADATD